MHKRRPLESDACGFQEALRIRLSVAQITTSNSPSITGMVAMDSRVDRT